MIFIDPLKINKYIPIDSILKVEFNPVTKELKIFHGNGTILLNHPQLIIEFLTDTKTLIKNLSITDIDQSIWNYIVDIMRKELSKKRKNEVTK